MTPDIAITAVGADRPGIVAALTGALLEVGGNLADARAALLRGSFAVMLVVSVPEEVDAAALERALAPVAAELGLGLWTGPAAPRAEAAATPARCVVSVYGGDHPGIVHALTSAMADAGANVIDLSARVVGDPPLYVLGIEVELPAGLDAAALTGRLRPVAGAQGVELAVEPEGDEVM